MTNIHHASRAMVRPPVCSHCGGPFGMVTHRWWGNTFCSRQCKETYLQELMLGRHAVLRWCAFLR
jgi:hypothetical protein